jgi:hypothetical protein
MSRYTAEGPTGQAAAGSPALGSALMPVPARLGQGYQSWGKVSGNPGTDPIPAPYPAGVPQGILPRSLGSTDATSTSSDAPPVWKPGIYYQPKLASRFHGATDSDNQMPVPANGPSGKPAVMARTPRFTRQRQVAWPITLPNYARTY